MPSFTYVADVWFEPVERSMEGWRAKGSVGVARKLTSVQRIAMVAVTGALCTSATDVMEVHANLWPVELLLHNICHRVALRLAVLPESHLLFKPVKVTAHRNVKRHRSPLHQILHAFKIQPTDFETLSPASRPPNCCDNLMTQVASSREESWNEDLLDKAEVCIYTDGSGLNDMAGAMAVMFQEGWEVDAI